MRRTIFAAGIIDRFQATHVTNDNNEMRWVEEAGSAIRKVFAPTSTAVSAPDPSTASAPTG